MQRFVKTIQNTLSGISGLLPARFVNPGMVEAIGQDLYIGVTGLDEPDGYDLLVDVNSIGATVNAALAKPPKTRRANRILNLHLSKSFFLEATHPFPKNARAEIDKALALYIRQNTPFASDGIIWRYEKTAQEKQVVIISQYILKTIITENLLSGFAAAGFKVQEIRLENSNLVFLDRYRHVTKVHDIWRKLGRVSLLAAVVMSLASSYLNFQKRKQVLAQITFENAALQEQALALRSELSTQQQADTELSNLVNKLNTDHQLLIILDTLTTILPDTVWLAQFTLRRGEVRIAGFASSAPSALVEGLEKNPLFSAARLSGPVIRDRRLEQDRFGMALTLAGSDE